MNNQRPAIADRLQGCANLVSTSIQMLTEHFANQHSAEGSRLTDTKAGALLAAFGLAAKELKQFLSIKSDATLWKWIKQGKIPLLSYVNSCTVWRLSELWEVHSIVPLILTDGYFWFKF